MNFRYVLMIALLIGAMNTLAAEDVKSEKRAKKTVGTEAVAPDKGVDKEALARHHARMEEERAAGKPNKPLVRRFSIQ